MLKLTYFCGLLLYLLLSVDNVFAKPRSTPTSQGGSGEPVSRTAGGGTRDGNVLPSDENTQSGEFQIPSPQSSGQMQFHLTPLVPQSNIILTRQERVNLYVYVPPIMVNKTAVLEIIDRRNQEIVFMEFFKFESAEAITRLVLPDTVVLAATPPSAQQYQWQLSVYSEQQSTAQVLATGWINRLEPSSDSSSMLWHENLELWFAQREENPNAWQQGLATETLEHYADYPVQTYLFGSPEHLQTAGES